MGRNSGTKQKVKKGLWSPEEDEKLYNYITRFGVGCWSSVPKLAGLKRCGKSCRLRWINYLRPDLKRGMFSQQEEDLIISLHEALGNRWAQIAAQLPGRTDNEIKNFWNSSLKKKLIKQGIDPNTHKIIKDEHLPNSTSSSSSHIDQQQSYHQWSSSSSSMIINGGKMQSYSRDDFSSKQVYDPLFLFDANFLSHFYDQINLATPYEIEIDHVNPVTRFSSMPDLTNFDHHNAVDAQYSDHSSSSCQQTMVQMNSNVVENGGSFSWDEESKMDQVFQFEYSGIEVEERKPCPGHFCNYPLSQELTVPTMDVFHGTI